jgi:hypothetical protein
MLAFENKYNVKPSSFFSSFLFHSEPTLDGAVSVADLLLDRLLLSTHPQAAATQMVLVKQEEEEEGIKIERDALKKLAKKIRNMVI